MNVRASYLVALPEDSYLVKARRERIHHEMHKVKGRLNRGLAVGAVRLTPNDVD